MKSYCSQNNVDDKLRLLLELLQLLRGSSESDFWEILLPRQSGKIGCSWQCIELKEADEEGRPSKSSSTWYCNKSQTNRPIDRFLTSLKTSGLIRWRKTFSIWPSLVTFGTDWVTFGTDWVDLGQFGKVGEDRVGGAQGSGAAPKAVHCIALTPHLPPKPLHHPPPHFCYHLGPTGQLQCQMSERSHF